MTIKFALLLVAVLAGCNAFPTPEEEQDMSIFFNYADPDARIIGGFVAPDGALPFMGVLTNGANVRGLVCGSSIIARRTVLTAAHCIRAVISGGSLSTSFRVTVGTNRWNAGGQMHAFSRAIVHGGYNANTIKNDIGILNTASIIVMTNLVRPVPVTYDWIGAGLTARVAGWGVTRVGGSASVNLMHLNVFTIDGNRCVRDVPAIAAQHNMRPPPVDPNIEICTFHSRNHGTCNGDSGGPLVRIDRVQQIGIVSWGIPCALGAPDIFVRVSAYRNWIPNYIIN